MEVSRKKVVRQEDRQWLMLPAVISLFFFFFGIAALIVDPFERADPRGMAMNIPLILFAALIVALTLAVAAAPVLLVRLGFFPGPKIETIMFGAEAKHRPTLVLHEAVGPARSRVFAVFLNSMLAFLPIPWLPGGPLSQLILATIGGVLFWIGTRDVAASWSQGRALVELNATGLRLDKEFSKHEVPWEAVECVAVWSTGGLTDAPAHQFLVHERGRLKPLSINISAATDEDRARLREELLARGRLVGGEGFEPPTLSV